MEVLPDEVLFTEIVGRLTGHIAILWVMCRRWHAEARKLQVRPVRDPLSTIAAEGHPTVLAWFREYYYDNTLTPDEINLVLECAAKGGHEPVCSQVQAWYPSCDGLSLMIGAAAGGHISLCHLAKSRQEQLGGWVLGLTTAVGRAAEGGFEDVCRLFKEWLDSDSSLIDDDIQFCSEMLVGAALGGHVSLCHLARLWGARNYHGMLRAAKLRTREPTDEIRCLAQTWLTLAEQGGGRILRLHQDGIADRIIEVPRPLDPRLEAAGIQAIRRRMAPRQPGGAPPAGNKSGDPPAGNKSGDPPADHKSGDPPADHKSGDLDVD